MPMDKSITFMLPSPSFRPVGGVKVILEYANRLADDGYSVHLVYPASLMFRQASAKEKIKSIIRYPYYRLRGCSMRRWFDLNPGVKEHLVLSLNRKQLPETGFYVATAAKTAAYLNSFDINNLRKLYLIQDYENWDNSEEFLLETYRYDLRKVVISKWLKEKVEKAGVKALLIPNGFDFEYFRQSVPGERKKRARISMLYHYQERKGCRYGLEALKIVKQRIPELEAVFFGVPARPTDLPDWIEYHQCPDRETHNRIYNESSIYLAPSLQEGWGLTVGEAMICGAAIVCTDALGFKEMVSDGDNGFIVPAGDAEALADKIVRLIEDDELRLRMGNRSAEIIKDFSWDNSYRKLRQILEEHNG